MTDSARKKERIIEQEVSTTASPLRVWEAWTDPAHISNWFVDRAQGEPRQGTIFTWCFDEFGMEIPYQVMEADPQRRFVLSFDDRQRSGLLEVDIRQEGGRTKVRLVNSGFEEGKSWDDEYEGVDSGWRMALSLMKLYLEEHYGKGKRNFMVMRPSPLPVAGLSRYFHEEARLQQWLAASGRIPAQGGGCRLCLKSGRQLTGRVLADSGREVQLSWDEIGGALALKAFSAGPDRPMAGLHVVSWEAGEQVLQTLRQEMEGCLDQLLQALPPAGSDV